jgi:Family of unknown function (DUF5939)
MTTRPSKASDEAQLSDVHEADARFLVLRQSASAEAAEAIEELVRNAPDRKLSRINVLDFASQTGLDEECVIAAFLHASRVGIFELSLHAGSPSRSPASPTDGGINGLERGGAV